MSEPLPEVIHFCNPETYAVRVDWTDADTGCSFSAAVGPRQRLEVHPSFRTSQHVVRRIDALPLEIHHKEIANA